MSEYKFIILSKHCKDITGQKFGHLTIIGPVGRDRRKQIIWLCRCSCNKLYTIRSKGLHGKSTQSCGCRVKESIGAANSTHRMSKTLIYKTWRGMIDRCTVPTNKDYKNWGMRGITICDEWKQSFQAFFDHATSLPHYGEKNRTLDRINNFLGYSPNNIRWATHIEQARNKRSMRILTYNNKTQCLTDWARELDIQIATLHKRLDNYGWSIEKALTTPVRKWLKQPKKYL